MIMRMTLGQLRKLLLREFGVDDTLRHQAGFFMHSGGSTEGPPPGLGNDEEQDEYESDEQQKKANAGVRVANRAGGTYGPTGT